MSKVFAVLAIVPGNPAPQFSIVGAETPTDALAGAAQSYMEAGHEDAQLVGIFTRDDLAAVDKALGDAEKELA
jgi:hypothetical protein